MGDYQIAGLSVRMKPTGRLAQHAQAFCAPAADSPQIDLHVPASILARSREQHPELSEEDWLYRLSGRAFAYQLLAYRGLVMHASAAELHGRAYLFSAPAGGGKTTHTQLWQQEFGARILNDDKPALRLLADGWQVYGTPWSGESSLFLNASAPLAGICFLEKGTENTIRRLSDQEVAWRMFESIACPPEPEWRPTALQLIGRLMTDVPLYLLTCTPDRAAVELSYRTLCAHDPR